MLRSMFSAVAGLRSHQTAMDVVGNNVANVNTAGYKSSRVTFAETMTQVVRGATSATAGAGAQGGVNPMQFGLGAQAAAVDGVFAQGAVQVTNRNTDLAIQGDGFFVVNDVGTTRYTRQGALSWDAAENLVTANGKIVQGWLAATPGPAATVTVDPANTVDINVTLSNYEDVSIAQDGTITGRRSDGTIDIVGIVALATFPNSGGLVRSGNGMFDESPNSGAVDIGQPASGNRGTMMAGSLEMSNVDLAAEFTNLILAQRGFQANARTITASDEILTDLVNLKR